MKLSVVVPVKNEADNIRPLIVEIQSALQDLLDYEIIYVDDGSDDNTWNELISLMPEVNNLKLVRHRISCGQSTALLSGVKKARGEWIATLDGDGQNDPADIPKLLQAMHKYTSNKQLDMVAGWRQVRYDNFIRRLSSRIANSVRKFMLHDAAPDSGCGLKLFRRSMFLELPYFSHMHRFLPALVRRAGGELMSVPVSHRPRQYGVSKYGISNRLWVGIIDMLGVRWLQKRSSLPEFISDTTIN